MISGDSIDSSGPLESWVCLFRPGLVTLLMLLMSLHSLSLSLDDSSQDKQRKDSPAPSPLSLRHQAGDIKLVQVILKIISAVDKDSSGIYDSDINVDF